MNKQKRTRVKKDVWPTLPSAYLALSPACTYTRAAAYRVPRLCCLFFFFYYRSLLLFVLWIGRPLTCYEAHVARRIATWVLPRQAYDSIGRGSQPFFIVQGTFTTALTTRFFVVSHACKLYIFSLFLSLLLRAYKYVLPFISTAPGNQ
ncbi:hypothetical protein GGS24DRAFT_167245 [Hypoxylon argillaceum]|nr:hypothetical protein GGS24DRAFT_167245 [Hypoxylon argillaceum]